MLTVTENAKQLLKEKIENRNDNTELTPRLSFTPPNKFIISLDKESEDDKVITHDDRKVLIVANELIPRLEEVTLDTKQSFEGSQLIILKR
jgi:Fe-S cluster assembly iron-binding protein IscA